MSTVKAVLGVADSVLDAIPAKQLCDPGLGAKLLAVPLGEGFALPLDLPAPPLAGQAVFRLSAGAALEVQLFNAADDHDDDGVLSGAAGDPPPPIAFHADAAWLKTGVTASVRASGGTRLADLGFDVEADAALILASYTCRACTEQAPAATRAALTSPRFAFRVEDVLALGPEDALLLEVPGSIQASLKLAWSDVLSGAMHALAPLVSAPTLVPIRVAASATLDASVAVRDRFLVVFSGVAGTPGHYRAAVRKARSTTASGGAGLNLSVSLPDPAALGMVLDSVVEATLGKAVRDALAAATGSLTDAQRRLLEGIARRLGLPTGDDLVKTVKDHVSGAVEDAVKGAVALGFSYSYQRIESTSSLLQVVIRGEAPLRHYHPHLLRGRLGVVLDALRAGEVGLDLETFLGQKSVDSRSSFGLSLGIGRWKFSGKDRRRTTRLTDADAAGHQRVSFTAARGYDGSWPGGHVDWSGTLAARMDGFSAGPVPRFSEYRAGLLLVWEGRAGKLRSDLRAQLDTALIWGALGPADPPDVEKQLPGAEEKSFTTSLQLRIDHGALRRMCDHLLTGGAPGFAGALAAAMPLLDTDEPLRADVRLRRTYYTPLWDAYLRDPGHEAQDYAGAAGRYFRRISTALAAREGRFQPPDPYTFGGLIDLDGDIAGACASFTSGLRTLAEAFSRDEPDNGMLERIVGQLAALCTQSLFIRAAGVYLVDLAAAAGVAGFLSRSVTITAGDDTLILGHND